MGGVCQGPLAPAGIASLARPVLDSDLSSPLDLSVPKADDRNNFGEDPDAIHVLNSIEEGAGEEEEEEGAEEIHQETSDPAPDQQQQAARSPLLIEKYGTAPSEEQIRQEQATPLMVHQYGTSTPKK